MPKDRDRVREFEPPDDDTEDNGQRARLVQRGFRVARQAPLDRADDVGM